MTQEQHLNLLHFQKAYESLAEKPFKEIAEQLINRLVPVNNKPSQIRIQSLLKNIREWDKNLETFIEYTQTIETNKEIVSLMTFHKSKGCEYSVVFATGFEQGILPHSSSFYENTSDLEEERRLAYVGLTRAKKLLYISLANERNLNNERVSQYPSQFISEIPDKHKEYI